METTTRGFASDNCSGAHPKVIEAIAAVNQGHTIAYGDDRYTESAIAKFKKEFGENIAVYFVFNGTAANVLSLNAFTSSFNGVICSDVAHVNVDECGAPEKFTGCKLIPVPVSDGKLTVELIKPHYTGIGFEHHVQPRIISLTQSTELGTVYSPAELLEITRFAHDKDMIVHMDGARIANAAASLGMSLNDVSLGAGVDILSFGGTKNGMMFGEAVVFANQNTAEQFKYIRKQGMQLASKMRFIAAQFDTMLTDELWRENALHSNSMASLLAAEAGQIEKVQITQPSQANGVFAILPEKWIPELQDESFFYVWDEATSEVRWMASFDTTEEDVMNFVKRIKQLSVS
jgi:threonine aldolase